MVDAFRNQSGRPEPDWRVVATLAVLTALVGRVGLAARSVRLGGDGVSWRTASVTKRRPETLSDYTVALPSKLSGAESPVAISERDGGQWELTVAHGRRSLEFEYRNAFEIGLYDRATGRHFRFPPQGGALRVRNERSADSNWSAMGAIARRIY